MIEFFEALARHQFLQFAVLGGLLASISCGVIGTYVVIRRISYIAGGIAHSVLAGMGLANYLNKVHGFDFIEPLHGAMIAALLGALIIGWVTLRAHEREDTVIGAIWAIGMALGIIFIALTPGYDQDLMSYLFGNILMIGVSDLWLIGALDLVVLTMVILFFRQFKVVCFDEEFARVRGLNVDFYYLLLLCLIALTVVVLVTVVGIIMVIALLTLPASFAGGFTRSIKSMMIVAVLVSSVVTFSGMAVSYGPDLPAGAVIIVLCGVVYLAGLVMGMIHRRSKSVRQYLR